MIVRISGEGQFEVNDEALKRLDALDTTLTEAMRESDGSAFHSALADMINLVQSEGTRVPVETIVPSDVIVPPADITMEEAERFFTDEGLMQPLV